MSGQLLGCVTSQTRAGVWALRILMATLVYLLVAGGLSPGFMAFGAPLHADVFRYFEIAHQPFALGVLANPRPLMLLGLRVLDVDNFSIFYSLLLLVPILLPLCLLAVFEAVREQSVGWASAVAYLGLCYVLPSFYELAPLDFGGACAGIMACCAALVLLRGPESVPRMVAYGLLTWVSLEFKPNYAFILSAFPLLILWKTGRRGSIVAALVALFVAAAVFLKDRWLGSAFINAQAGSSYQLLGNPSAIFGAFGFYLQRLLSPAGWCLFMACAALSIHRFGWRPVGVLIALALAAILPMLLIPNHRFAMYAWYASSMLLLALPLAISAIPEGVWRPAYAAPLLGLIAFALWGEAHFLSVHRFWYVANQQSNANVLKSFEQLRAAIAPGKRVLISGRLTPYVPFKNDGFAARLLPAGVSWTVVTPPSEEVLIATSNNTKRYVPMAAVNGADYDIHVEYGDDGRIDRIGPPSPDLGPSGDTPTRRKLLFCAPGNGAETGETAACLQTIH